VLGIDSFDSDFISLDAFSAETGRGFFKEGLEVPSILGHRVGKIDRLMSTFYLQRSVMLRMRRALVNGIPDVSGCDSIPIELELWIEAARRGDKQALGQALSFCRDYLLLVANDGLRPELRRKGNASDMVQETFLRAQRGIESFRGRTASEWRNWLRSILLRNLAEEGRRFGVTAKRQVQREVTIPEGAQFECARTSETPSSHLARREREAALIDALERLPAHYRDVVIWHHREQLSFEEIAQRLGNSAEAARKLWTRALGSLRKELGPTHDSR
jgi:RNA polymerase sigma-70 factor, ECF subfamily